MEITTLEEYLRCVSAVYKKVNKRDTIPAENLVEHVKEWETRKNRKFEYDETTNQIKEK